MLNITQLVNTSLQDFNGSNNGREVHPGLAAEAVGIYVGGIVLLALIAITCGYRDKIKASCISFFRHQSDNATPVPEIVVSSANDTQRMKRTEGREERTEETSLLGSPA